MPVTIPQGITNLHFEIESQGSCRDTEWIPVTIPQGIKKSYILEQKVNDYAEAKNGFQ